MSSPRLGNGDSAQKRLSMLFEPRTRRHARQHLGPASMRGYRLRNKSRAAAAAAAAQHRTKSRRVATAAKNKLSEKRLPGLRRLVLLGASGRAAPHVSGTRRRRREQPAPAAGPVNIRPGKIAFVWRPCVCPPVCDVARQSRECVTSPGRSGRHAAPFQQLPAAAGPALHWLHLHADCSSRRMPPDASSNERLAWPSTAQGPVLPGPPPRWSGSG